MELLTGILTSTIALGAIYAASSVSLALLWGSISMLNLAHGAMIVIGAYGSVAVVTGLGLPWWTGLLGGMIAGAAGGLLLYVSQVRWIFGKANFDLRIIILTMAFSTIVVDLINNLIGPKILRQPFQVERSGFDLGVFSVGNQTILRGFVLQLRSWCWLLQLVVHKTNLGSTDPGRFARHYRRAAQWCAGSNGHLSGDGSGGGDRGGLGRAVDQFNNRSHPWCRLRSIAQGSHRLCPWRVGQHSRRACAASFALAATGDHGSIHVFGVKWGFPVSLSGLSCWCSSTARTDLFGQTRIGEELDPCRSKTFTPKTR